MGKVTLVITIILIVVVVVLLLALSLIVYRMAKNRKRYDEITKISEMIKEGRLKKSDTILSRVRRISDSNPKFKGLYKRLSNAWDKMSDHINIMVKELSKLKLLYKKMPLKTFRYKIKEFQQEIEILNDTETRFNAAASTLTQQDEFTRSEKAFYNKNLRIAIDVYKDKRVLLDRISPKIDNLIKEITGIAARFNKALARANTIEINNSLRDYSKKVIEFCSIINKGPALQNYIYNIIPKMSDELLSLYKTKKIELHSSLQHINFVKSVENISKQYEKTKVHFKILKLNKAEEGIRGIIKSIKIIEKMINSEVSSRNIFVQSYQRVINETTNVLTEFVEIKLHVKNIKEKRIKVSDTFKEAYRELVSNASVIDNEALEFKSLIKSNKIPFSSKMSRMKLLTQKIDLFIREINEINGLIFDLDLDKTILRNKFIRSKNAFEELVTNIKGNSIKIKNDETVLIQELNERISSSAKRLAKEKITSEDTDYIESTITKIISFYKLLAGPVEIAEIVKKLITKLSIDRAVKDELNYQLAIAEKEYLEGKYASSLNVIIQYLEGE